MNRVGFLILFICAISSVQAQWLNSSRNITKPIHRVKIIDSTAFFIGEKYIYRTLDKGLNIDLISKDSIDFDDVVKNKDTFYILGHYYYDSYFRGAIFTYKLFPGEVTINSSGYDYRNSGPGFFYGCNYKDSMVMIIMHIDTRPSNYLYYLVSGLARNEVFFNGSSGKAFFVRDSFNLRQYFLRDSSLFLLCNYQPKSNKTQTIVVRRNMNKYVSDYTQYDSIINLPRANALFMFNDSAGIIIGDTYIAKSLNYTTWNIKYNCPNCNFKQVWFTSEDSGYVVGSKSGKALILKSMDGGVTWREQVCPVTAPLNDIKFTDDGKVGLIVGDSGTILRTENGGGTSFVGVNSSKIKSPNFNLYPNPANNQLIIVNYQLPIHSTYSIYTIQGKLLQEGLVQENETIVDTHKYHPGLYFITIGTTILKFVKQ